MASCMDLLVLVATWFSFLAMTECLGEICACRDRSEYSSGHLDLADGVFLALGIKTEGNVMEGYAFHASVICFPHGRMHRCLEPCTT